ncbi:hypothetical protein ACVXZZ_04235 [Staphylococcus aureus]
MLSLYGDVLLPIYLQNLRELHRDSLVFIITWFSNYGSTRTICNKLLDTIGLKPLAIFGIAKLPMQHAQLMGN